MLDRLHQLAHRTQVLRSPLTGVGLLALGVAIWDLLRADGSGQIRWFLPSLLLACWCCLWLSGIALFRAPPPVPDPHQRRWRRMVTRLQRGALYVVALAFAGLTLALLLTTAQLLRLA